MAESRGKSGSGAHAARGARASSRTHTRTRTTAAKKTAAKKSAAKKTGGKRSSPPTPAARKKTGARTNTRTRTPNQDAATSPSRKTATKKTAKKTAVRKAGAKTTSKRARPSAAGGRARTAAKKTTTKKTAAKKSATRTTTRKTAAKKTVGRSAGRGGGVGGMAGQMVARLRPRLTPLDAFDLFLRRIAIFGVVASFFMIAIFIARLPSTDGLMTIASTPSMTLVDVRGRIITTRGLSRGATVDVKDLPPYVPQAVLAIEDRRFYSHFGVDPIGLARATYVNLKAGHVVQGGSTITQQLAKNLFLSPERTFRRKMQEMALAIWLEVKFTKDEILTLYLNRVYMGAGTYGIEAASQRYFAKSAQELTLPEAALLAGLLKAPSRYAPTSSMERAQARAEVVLAAMVDAGLLTEDERFTANRRVTRLAEPAATPGAHYFADWVVEQVPDYVGEAGKDLIVETTLDLTFQRAAEIALVTALETDGERLQVSEGAVIALDLDGGVRAMVGGRSYQRSQYNRVTLAKRQPGSAFKPFVYLAALERGWSPSDLVVDAPVRIGSWAPTNYKNEYQGEMTLSTALAKSVNTVAVKVGHEVGSQNIVRTAERMGLRGNLNAVDSLPLGTGEVTPLSLATAYVPFANGGHGVFPHAIKRIRTVDGEIIYERHGSGPGEVVNPYNVRLMNSMLARVVQEGTGRGAQLETGRPMAGKTGTSQDFRDAWFVGYTANMVAAVWVGNDDSAPMNRVTGGSLPAVVWKDFLTRAGDNGPLWDLPGVGGLYEDVGFVEALPEADFQPLEEESEGGFFRRLGKFLGGD